ncbi:MAG: hypothetical protein H9W81_13985 [Enterococcus sp.]|nr:hypothetical protein [Enterococcus sp.]
MSRTIKTRPLHVRVMDPKDHSVGVEEIHNHTKGYCDLPERTIDALNERYELLASGEYEVSRKDTCLFSFSYKGTNICGCLMCTGQMERKEKARRTRHETRTSLNQEAKRLRATDYLEEVLEEDTLL